MIFRRDLFPRSVSWRWIRLSRSRGRFLRKHFQHYIAGTSSHFLVRIRAAFDKLAAQNVIRFVSGTLPLSALHRSLELEPDTVYHFRREIQPVPLNFDVLEKLIEEGALVTVPISVARNKSRNMAVVFHRELHEFSFFQEGVHAGPLLLGPLCGRVRTRRRCGGLRGSRRRLGILRTRKHADGYEGHH